MIKVVLVGGPDVDARIPLIKSLNDEFIVHTLGSNPSKCKYFAENGLHYELFHLDRGSKPFSDLKTFWELISLIKNIRPDIIHTFDTKPAVWGRLAAWLCHVPVIIGTLPGLGALYSQSDLRTRFIRCIYQPLQKLACHISDLTIFQNPDDNEHFIQNGIVLREKTAILSGSGVETSVFDLQRFALKEQQQLRASLGLNETKVIVTMISRLIRSKGVLEFAEVARHICEVNPQVVFLLVGSDDNESVDSLTEIEQDGLVKSVVWLGARNDIPGLLAISDIFVLPTYYREGIPRVLLEAAAMGLPIITTQSPGCTEVVENNLNGFLVPARDNTALKEAIENLIVDSPLRKQFGKASRHLAVTRFDLSIIAEQTAKIYKQLFEEKMRGRKADS